MTMSSAKDVTQLLLDWSSGDRAALDQLMPLVYDELHRLADLYMRRERPDHTLQPTALVHEAYLRLIDQTRVQWQNRAHFVGVAARLMRRILAQHAQRYQAVKRGAAGRKVPLDEATVLTEEQAAEVIAADDALTSLAAIDPQQSRIVELRFFGGLTIEEAAEVMGISPATVKREWRVAKAWLQREIKRAI
jgi:RNA polymerase sigma factor (TIGR02999 family)